VPRRFGYDPHPHHGDHFSRMPDFSVGASHTHVEPKHLDGPRFPHCGSRPTGSSGEVLKIVKSSSNCIVKCWIPMIYLTNLRTEPSSFFSSYLGDGRRLGGHVAHGFRLFMTHDQK
jgi:hypothetical protein